MKVRLLMASIAVTMLSIFALPLVANAAAATIYNNIPSPVPSNVPSIGYEATSTSEFGGQVQFTGTDRSNPTVTVLMSSWACQTGTWSAHDCVTTPGATFTHPITLNVYNVGASNSVGSLITTQTKTFALPYRPSADATHCTAENAGKWWDGSVCVNGKASLINFNLTGILPNTAIITVAYNTSDYGVAPLGAAPACHSQPAGCPYDSLNVGTNPTPSAGTALPTINDAYQSSTWAGAYCDNGTAGTGTLRLDAGCWTGYLPALKVEAQAAPASYPTNKDQCKNGGWKLFTNPSFKNQGKCEDWVHAKANGDLKLSGPSQRIDFKVTNNDDAKQKKNAVEYWNYDYPGVLHYKADVICSYVNPQTNETRFMFQIPAGHPGLSGLYIVAYAKEVNQKHSPDLYGHAATADLATATQWCQTGVGFSPTMYTVTMGHVEVKE